ncbi:hypothetical protein ACN47E_001209 [Coniothyrium glycines]
MLSKKVGLPRFQQNTTLNPKSNCTRPFLSPWHIRASVSSRPSDLLFQIIGDTASQGTEVSAPKKSAVGTI